MAKFLLLFASLSGGIGVALGAFGAHALKTKLESQGLLSTYSTAVQYQFYHTLALAIIGIIILKYPLSWFTYSGISMCIGIVLFSGSLYTLSLTGVKWLGAITPLGGLFFIIGWVTLFIGIIKTNFNL